MHARARVNQLRGKLEDYTAFTFFTEYCQDNYTTFNSHNAQSGFGGLPPALLRVGFGMSMKSGRMMYDFYYGTVGLGGSVKKGDEKISANLSNLFQLQWGFLIIKRPKFNLWPYAGLSIRYSNIKYKTPALASSNPVNITGMIQGDRSITLQSTKPGYEAGIGMEFLVWENPGHTGGVMLFLKAGTNSAFAKEKYKYADIVYQPGIRQAGGLIAVGVKLFGKN